MRNYGCKKRDDALLETILRGIFDTIKLTIKFGILIFILTLATNAIFGTNDGLSFFKDRSLREITILADRNMDFNLENVKEMIAPITAPFEMLTSASTNSLSSVDADVDLLKAGLQELNETNAEIKLMIEEYEANK